MKDNDIQPFPIQGEMKNRSQSPSCSVPSWLARLAHREYARLHDQAFERIAERGGFSRAELVALIRGDYTNSGIGQAEADLAKQDEA